MTELTATLANPKKMPIQPSRDVTSNIPAREVAAHIVLGVISLIMLGALPMLLAALVDMDRLSLSGIGKTYTVIVLTMGVTNILAGIYLKPVHLRPMAFVAVLCLAILDASYPLFDQTGIFIACFLAGAAQGLLMWIGLGALVRRMSKPARWAAILFTSATIAELINSSILARIILPNFGVASGFHLVAAISLIGLIAALFIPNRYTPIGDGETAETRGVPPPRGWIALIAATLIGAGAGAVIIYLLPLLNAAGLDTLYARDALSFALAGQVIGGFGSMFAATRLHYFPALIGCTIILLAAMLLYGIGAPLWLIFVAATGFGGASVFTSIFVLPMTIHADATRRAATLIGSTSLVGAALGPFLTSTLVEKFGVHSALYVGALMLIAGMAMVVALRLTASRYAIH